MSSADDWDPAPCPAFVEEYAVRGGEGSKDDGGDESAPSRLVDILRKDLALIDQSEKPAPK